MNDNHAQIAGTPALLAALPAMLGFVPENSIIAIGIDDANINRCSVRHDVDAYDWAAAEHITAALAANAVTSIVAVAVADDDHMAAALRGQDRLVTAAIEAGLDVRRVLLTSAITAGAEFTDRDTGSVDVIPDPAASALSAQAVLAGRVTAPTRADLQARFAMAAEVPVTVVRHDEEAPAAALTALATTIVENAEPTDELIALTGAVLIGAAPEVQSAFLALVTVGDADAAATTMTRVAAGLRGTARASALSVAAFCFYCKGNGPAVGIAIEAAIDAASSASVPVPVITRVVDALLRDATPPATVLRLIPTPEEVEAATGIRLPTRTGD
ncbi:DUF4192 family protein [Actinomycetes bacterium M1A6_2h]